MKRLTINTNSPYGYELKANNPNTSLAQDQSEAIQKLGRIEDVADELASFLMYLDCLRMGAEGNLTGDGYFFVRTMMEKYPQFKDVRVEVKKFIDVLEAEV